MRIDLESSQTAQRPIRIAIVSNSAGSAETISRRLGDDVRYEILGYVTARSAFATALRQAAPDVVILEDVGSPAATVANARRIRAAVPTGKLVLLLASADAERRTQLASVGADAIVGAACLEEGFGTVVGELAAGNLRLSPRPMPSASSRGDDVRLGPREREILRLVAEGHPDAAIAARLWVTTQMVRGELSGLYAKLGVPGRAEAAVYAQAQGLIESDEALPEAVMRARAAAA
jgi:DNA-binding NarL/FixJ family response regulator